MWLLSKVVGISMGQFTKHLKGENYGHDTATTHRYLQVSGCVGRQQNE